MAKNPCNLSEAQIANLYTGLAKSVFQSKNKGIPFDINQFMRNLYDGILAKTNDPINALDYIQQIPRLLITLHSRDEEAADYLADSNVDLGMMDKLRRDFRTPENIATYLNIGKTGVKDLMQQEVDKASETSEVLPTDKYEQIEENDKAKKEKAGLKFVAMPETGLATFVQEAKNYDGVSEKDNILDEDKHKQTYFKLVRKINDLIGTSFNADKVKIGDTEGIFLRLMPARNFPVEELYISEQKYLSRDDTAGQFPFNKSVEEKAKEREEQSVYLVYTDRNGEILYFDENANVTTKEAGGKMLYTTMRRSFKPSKDDPQKGYKAGVETFANVQSPEVKAARRAPASTEERERLIKEFTDVRNAEIQINKLSREYILKNPDAILLYSVRAGSNGYIQEDYGNPVKISSLNIPGGFVPYYSNNEFGTKQKGGVYFNVAGYPFPVLIRRPKFAQVESLTDNIANMLFSEDFGISDRLRVIRQFTYSEDTNVFEKDGELFFTQNGNTYAVKDAANKQVFIDNLNKQTVNINRSLINKETFDMIVSQQGKLSLKKMNYDKFLADNFFTFLQPNAQGNLLVLNAYNIADATFETQEKILSTISAKASPSVQEVRQSSKLDQESPTDKSLEDFKKAVGKINFGLTKQRALSSEATEKQIEAARQWYNNSPLKRVVPFEVAFNVFNSNKVAEFTAAGIRLLNGSNYTDLYHEGWHVFSQMFLTKDQKQALYNEARNLTGSFKTFKGKTIKFKDASDIELEEFMAEDFRKYVLSDGKRIVDGRSARNNIFNKIYSFLKAVFSGYSVKSYMADREAQGVLKDMYDKLYIGDINDYTPTLDNIQFTTLNKGIQLIGAKESENIGLNYQDSRTVVETIDGIMASTLANTYGVGAIFVKPEIVGELYNYAKNQFIEIRDAIETKEDKSLLDENSLRVLNTAIDNWGSYRDVLNGEMNGTVAYHKRKSKYISFEDKFAEFSVEEKDEILGNEQSDNKEDDEVNLGLTEKQKQEQFGTSAFEQKGNEHSVYELASNETVYLIKSLPAVDKNGNIETNAFGKPKLVDFNRTWGKVINIVQGAANESQMYERLKKAAVSYPELNALVERLGDPNLKTDLKDWPYVHMWKKFFRDFSVYKIPINEVRVVYNPENGTYKVDFTESAPRWMQAKNEMASAFSVAKGKYIKSTPEGNYLNIEAVKKQFKNAPGTVDEALDFLRAVGVTLTDNNAIRAALAKQLESVRWIYTDVVEAKEIKNPLNYAKISGRLENLLTIETKYSGKYSNNSVENVNGDQVYDLSLNNTSTQVVKELNDPTKDYTMTNEDHLSHLNFRKNPFVKASIWLNSLFYIPHTIENLPSLSSANTRRQNSDLKKRKGEVYANISLINLDGIKSVLQKTVQELQGGIKTTELDPNSKFLMDLHMMLMNGTMELPRHASKSTAYGVLLSNVLTKYNEIKVGNKNLSGHLYIGSGHFATNQGMNATVDLMKDKLAAEMERIAIVKSGEIDNVLDFNEKGAVFTIFDDILNDTLQKKLIEKAKVGENFREILDSEEFTQDIANDVTAYFENLTAENINFFNEMAFMSPEIKKNTKDMMLATTGKKNFTDTEVINTAIKSFTVNAYIHNLEAVSVLYGDLAMFNHYKEEFHKRNASIGSTGRIFSTDASTNTFINNLHKHGSTYAKTQLGVTPKPWNGKLNTAVFKDRIRESIYHKEMVDRFVSEGYTEEEAKKVLKPYLKMNEGDAQGWITFDTYRALKIAEGTWGDQQNNLFNKIVNKQPVDPQDVTRYFPPLKLQYAGPLMSKKLHLQAFHKFSLAPLIPSVVGGTKMQTLHDNLVKQGFDYALFQSGSKMATIIKEGATEPDQLFQQDDSIASWDGREETRYTPNTIFLQYLKNQLDINDQWKDKSIFSTQLRKLIINDLFKNGIPVDDNLGKLVEDFEKLLDKYQEVKKQELLEDMGWKMENGLPKGNIASLVKFIRKEFSRLELADHTLDFIDVDTRTKLLKNDLSLSLEADKIEKLLSALVIKRLIRQKLNGEQLVQVSGAGFESQTKFREATGEELLKYKGTTDLPFYRYSKKGTSAMKVKIAMKGDFYKLLKLNHEDGKEIATLTRLNEMLKNDKWLDKGNNRKMVTLTAVRIPVQGLNSMEFMEVYEFLPEEAGNIIIPPAEIVAKSGSDFDIDKLTVFMPNIGSDIDRKKFTDEAFDKLKEKYPTLDFSKNNVNILLDAAKNNFQDYTPTPSEMQVYKIIQDEFSSPFYHTGGTKGVENKIIENITAILSHPKNFTSLVRPNDTDLTKGVAMDLAKYNIQGYNPYANKTNPERKNKEGKTVISPTRVLEARFNANKHNAFNIGKKTLGIGAVDNSFSSLFKRIGSYLNPSFTKYKTDDFGNLKMKNGKPAADIVPIQIRMKHNTVNVNGKEYISLSDIDTVTKEKTSVLIAQLMNGWVDIEKDDWIFHINGNNIAGPVLLFMLETGVDFKTAAHFVSQPLVVDYIKERYRADSPFYAASGKSAEQKSFRAYKIRMNIFLNNPKLDKYIQYTKMTGEPYLSTSAMYKAVNEFNEGIEYNVDNLTGLIESKDKESNFAIAGLLHFMQLEETMKQLTNAKLTMNVDTRPTKTITSAQQKLAKIQTIEQRLDALNPTFTSDLKIKSPISSFFVQDFQLGILKALMNVRGNDLINRFLVDELNGNAYKKMFQSDEKFISAFHNDFILYLMQNHLKDIDILKMTEYSSLPLTRELPVEKVQLEMGAFVKNGKIYIDPAQIKKDFDNRSYSKKEYSDLGLHVLPVGTFQSGRDSQINFKEYSHFVLEREYLRYMTPVKEGQSREEYEKNIATRALEKTFNFYYNYSIKSEGNIASQLKAIQKEFPELEKQYMFFDMAVEKTDYEKKIIKVLGLKSSRLDESIVNTLHENLQALSDFNVVKVSNPEDNRRISNFFNRLIVAEFLRSGMTKGSENIAQVLPTEAISMLMRDKLAQLEQEGGITEQMIKDYYERFKKNWSKAEGVENKNKGKLRNYINPISSLITDIDELEKGYRNDMRIINDQVMTFVPKEELSLTKALLESNKDVIFIYPSNTKGTEENSTRAYMRQGNSYGIPVKTSGGVFMTDETYEDNIKEIDNALEGLATRLESDAPYIAFPNSGITSGKGKGGVVQEMLRSKAPKTYTYLVTQLYNKFGYTHPGAQNDLGFRESYQTGQEVSDAEVKEFMKNCFSK